MWAPEKRKRIEVDSPTTYYILGKQTDEAGLFAGPTLVLGATRSIKIKVIFNFKIKKSVFVISRELRKKIMRDSSITLLNKQIRCVSIIGWHERKKQHYNGEENNHIKFLFYANKEWPERDQTKTDIDWTHDSRIAFIAWQHATSFSSQNSLLINDSFIFPHKLQSKSWETHTDN